MAAGIEEEGEAGLTAEGGGGQAGGFWGGVERIGVDSGAGAEEIDACEGREREQKGLRESKERREVCVETAEVEREEGERKGLGGSKERKGKVCMERVQKEACMEKEEREKKVFGEGTEREWRVFGEKRVKKKWEGFGEKRVKKKWEGFGEKRVKKKWEGFGERRQRKWKGVGGQSRGAGGEATCSGTAK